MAVANKIMEKGASCLIKKITKIGCGPALRTLKKYDRFLFEKRSYIFRVLRYGPQLIFLFEKRPKSN